MLKAAFQVYRDESEAQEWRFRLVDDEGENVLRSEGYTRRENCLQGIAAVRRSASTDERYERLIAEDGKFYFNLKASNGEVIGTGDLCVDEATREKNIEIVKRIASEAELLEA